MTIFHLTALFSAASLISLFMTVMTVTIVEWLVLPPHSFQDPYFDVEFS